MFMHCIIKEGREKMRDLNIITVSGTVNREPAYKENKENPAPAISNIGYIQPVLRPPPKKHVIIIIPNNIIKDITSRTTI